MYAPSPLLSSRDSRLPEGDQPQRYQPAARLDVPQADEPHARGVNSDIPRQLRNDRDGLTLG